ncbi:hypothetical protein OIV83_004265 [Microbotryomycetes sp. JL201]|nr:hypothetical protein OIV83_004265 [Microbotryomycetes sp. JL201]
MEQNASMSSIEKSAEQQVERQHDEIAEAQQVTARSWLFALLGAMVYVAISFHLSATAIIRTSWATTFNQAGLSVWLINTISVFQACLGPPLMFSSDLFGRRNILVVATAIASAGCAVGSRSTSFGMAVAGQSMAGVGMACVGAAYAIPSEVFPRKSRGAVQAILSVAASVAGAVGAFVAGALLKNDAANGWHKVLYVSTALFGTAFILLAIFYFPPARKNQFSHLTRAEKSAMLDYVGYVLIIAALCTFLTGTTYGGIVGWRAGKTLGPLITGIVLMIVFGVWEWKGTRQGLLHHGMFKGGRNFPVALAAMALEGVIFFNILAFVPVAASALWQPQDSFLASAYIAPFYLASIPFFFLIGWYTYKFKDFRGPLIVGYAIYVISCACLSTAGREDGKLAWVYVTLSGIGFSAPISLLVAVAQLAVPGEFIGACSALMVSARGLGGSIGTAIYGAILGSKISANIANKIAEGAFKGGLSPANAPQVLPQLIPLVASQNPGLIQSAFRLPGVTPPMVLGAVHGMQDAVAEGLKYVFIAGAAFAAAGVLSIFALASSKESLTAVVDAPAQETGDANKA